LLVLPLAMYDMLFYIYDDCASVHHYQTNVLKNNLILNGRSIAK